MGDAGCTRALSFVAVSIFALKLCSILGYLSRLRAAGLPAINMTWIVALSSNCNRALSRG
jgi:hypothetical protein